MKVEWKERDEGGRMWDDDVLHGDCGGDCGGGGDDDNDGGYGCWC